MDNSSIQTSPLSKKITIKTAYKSLSPKMVLFFWCSVIVSICLFFSALIVFNKKFLVISPTYGGEIHEGLLGTPRFVNPVLATSDQDKDLTTLIFSGLTKRDSMGQIVLDLAESITPSDDKLSYDVLLKKNTYFHDGTIVTVDDIIYTLSLIQNPSIKSPHKVEWEGVTFEKKSENELVFTLKKPFPLFMNSLTIGIVPKHIWKNLTDEQISLSDYNIHAIGSGPYMISSVVTDSGIPTTFQLKSNKHYTLGRPYVSSINLTMYQSEKYLLRDFDNGTITRMHGLSADKIAPLNLATSTIHTSLLPRTFEIFFNPNKASALSNKQVRQALQMAINKQDIVDTVLLKYGKVINDPYPFEEDETPAVYDPVQAKVLLTNSKALKKASTTLEINLATANTDEMKKVAEMIINDWNKIGVKTTLSVYEVSDLNQNIIKDRDFQALLFGSITQDPSDLYAFWHSSQRTYPGLNISNYVSKKLDTNLEILRSSDDELARVNAYEDVKKEFSEEVPGIFLFSPSLIYIVNDKTISPIPLYSLDSSSRFILVESWHRYTETIWPKTYSKQINTLIENILH